LGAYLTEDGRLKIARLTDAPPESNQVVFTTHIIKDYRIVESKVAADLAKVTVEYESVGVIAEDFYKFTVHQRQDRFDFELKKSSEGIWRVSNYPAPNMAVETVTRYLEQVARTAHNPKYFREVAARIREAAK
jgi:uncharacterized protein YozE (UPF0346 family)